VQSNFITQLLDLKGVKVTKISHEVFFASTFSLFLQTPSAAATQGNLRVIFH